MNVDPFVVSHLVFLHTRALNDFGMGEGLGKLVFMNNNKSLIIEWNSTNTRGVL